MRKNIYGSSILLSLLAFTHAALAKGSDQSISLVIEVPDDLMIGDDLAPGLVKLAIPLVGIGVIAFGIWLGVSSMIAEHRSLRGNKTKR